MSLLTNKCKDNILDSTETNNYKNINHTEANENNLVSEISIERENKIKNMKNNIQNKISDKKELKKIQEYHSQKKVINNFRKNNPNKNNNVIKVNRYNSNKNKNVGFILQWDPEYFFQKNFGMTSTFSFFSIVII